MFYLSNNNVFCFYFSHSFVSDSFKLFPRYSSRFSKAQNVHFFANSNLQRDGQTRNGGSRRDRRVHLKTILASAFFACLEKPSFCPVWTAPIPSDPGIAAASPPRDSSCSAVMNLVQETVSDEVAYTHLHSFATRWPYAAADFFHLLRIQTTFTTSFLSDRPTGCFHFFANFCFQPRKVFF